MAATAKATKVCYGQPCAWVREWDGDESDIGMMVIEYGAEPPGDNHQWFPLYAESKELYEALTG